jgi:hypothetical protein
MKLMRLWFALLLLLFTFSGIAAAQRSMGYWYAAPGAVRAGGHDALTVHLGGGGEFAIWKGISAGIEAGAVGATRNYTESLQGTASANGYYHFFRSKTARYDPFVTGGYSLFFRRGTANLGNYGAGLNYWFLQHLGARVEVRDHVLPGNGGTHFWGIRMGFSFTQLQP